MDFKFTMHLLDLLDLGEFHPVVPESIFSLFTDVRYFPHGLNRLNIDISIILDRLVSNLLQSKDAVLRNLLVMHFTIGFCPGEFSGVMLSLEMSMAFGSTEEKAFRIIPDEKSAMTWVNGS